MTCPRSPHRPRCEAGRLRARRWLLALGLLLLCFGGRPLRAPALEAEKQRIVAAFILNFVRYTRWPEQALPPAAADFNICLYDSEEIAVILRAAQAQVVHNRRLSIRPFRRSEPEYCQVLYIPANLSPPRSLRETWQAPHMLTISDGYPGAVIELFESDARLRFRIDRPEGERRGLEFSAQLLKVAAETAGR